MLKDYFYGWENQLWKNSRRTELLILFAYRYIDGAEFEISSKDKLTVLAKSKFYVLATPKFGEL